MMPLPTMALTEAVVTALTISFSGLVPSKIDVPIPILPELVNRAFSLLFVLTTRSIASVVPMKFVPTVVPELPVGNHAVVADGLSAAQVSTPVPSLVNGVFAAPCATGRVNAYVADVTPELNVRVLALVLLEYTREPLVPLGPALPVRIVPFTSNVKVGLMVLTPKFPELVNRARSVPFVLTTKSMASVVPIKFVPAVVPELPVGNHAFEVDGVSGAQAAPAQ